MTIEQLCIDTCDKVCYSSLSWLNNSQYVVYAVYFFFLVCGTRLMLCFLLVVQIIHIYNSIQ